MNDCAGEIQFFHFLYRGPLFRFTNKNNGASSGNYTLNTDVKSSVVTGLKVLSMRTSPTILLIIYDIIHRYNLKGTNSSNN